MADADRDMRAEVSIAAPPERVWELLTRTRTHVDASPELVAMLPLKPGGFREGQWFLGLNRRKAVVWPTRNVVTAVVPHRRLAWDTTTSGARWLFELEPAASGTRLVQHRVLTKQLTKLSTVFATALLGGVSGHADELEEGMAATLHRLKHIAENT
ncbi:SRPBCC family protein [Saccharopolyspora rhizosphaerae]|uniref:SRPBCC family protein n=1 Tax=Saccharopolyspora rhizosphaerae TaxID=2492662 RepID=A0A3R8Q3U3_9PSEU|nr:SRPBCC family protein [Saccharopolyspora rhizosphaerae]RRO17955.1 SRPBCC family protein [Saccharopolyspora rhizosphaerae]